MTTNSVNSGGTARDDKPPKRVVLGITGGVAAYKAAELTRLLRKSGVEVQVIMTDAGAKFITPVTLQALSGRTVFTDTWDPRIDNHMAHIELSRGADAILIAPASADFLAKLATGQASDLLSTLCLARQPDCRLLVAPAMNREMWENPATVRNCATLTRDGITILGPDAGDQACGETGPGRMLEPQALLEATLAVLGGGNGAAGTLAGRRALVTAGPTFEPIDPVRGLTNRSSGKMGYALAAALVEAGAEVVLISGPTALPVPTGARIRQVETASQMLAEVKGNLAGVDLFFAVAAVADYAPAAPQTQKIKKSTASLTLDLAPTVDILAWVASQPRPPFCIGFAAESQNVVEYARKKRENKKIPMIVANHATSAIGADDNQITIIDGDAEHPLPRMGKAAVARAIVSHAAQLFNATATSSTAKTPLKSIKNA